LELFLFFIYDDASEALHATMYGCLFHYGVFEPRPLPKTTQEIGTETRKSLATAFWLGIVSLFELNKYLFGLTGQIEELKEAQHNHDLAMDSMKYVLRKK
jgi:hypothetical protein